jgi:hypothetical protein
VLSFSAVARNTTVLAPAQRSRQERGGAKLQHLTRNAVVQSFSAVARNATVLAPAPLSGTLQC